MAEIVTFAAEGILSRVASLAEQEFSLLWGFKGEVAELKRSLSQIQAMLRDAAHHSQFRGESVQMWVKDLEDVAQDADEVLEEYRYEVLRRQVELGNRMEKKKKNLRILVAGGGIGGLVFALAMKKKGFDVVVFEKDLSAVRGDGQYRGPI